MSDDVVTELATFAFPFNKNVALKNVAQDNGVNWLRITIREGRRFTIIDLDPYSAAEFGAHLSAWAQEKQD